MTNKVAIVTIATGPYLTLFKELKLSLELFLPNSQKHVFVFSSDDFESADVTVVKISKLPWPLVTLMRFHHFNTIADQLKEFDFVYYLDSDMLIADEIDEEVLPASSEIVAVTHPFFKNEIGPFEPKQFSQAYVENRRTLSGLYCQGCFFGGSSASFVEMSAKISQKIEIDLQRNFIADVHDESYLNKYLLETSCKRLHSGYAKPKNSHPFFGSPEILDPIKIIHRNEHSQGDKNDDE
jgi:hypothetical protein